MKRKTVTGILLLQLTLLAAPTLGRAAVPPLVPVQGYLTDDADVPSNGVYKVSFTLFDANAAGTTLFTTTEPVVVAKGRFTVYLGDKQQLQLDKLHSANAVWLEVTIVQSCGSDVNCTSPTAVNKTLAPRLQFATGAFAASAAFCSTADNARALGGMTAAQLQPKIADVTCGPNMFVSGLQAGVPMCTSASGGSTSSGPAPTQSSLPDVACPAGQLLSGIQGGRAVCVPRPMDGNQGPQGEPGMPGASIKGDKGDKGDMGDPGAGSSFTYVAGVAVTADSSNRQSVVSLGGHKHCAFTQTEFSGAGDGSAFGCKLNNSPGMWALTATSAGQTVFCKAQCFD